MKRLYFLLAIICISHPIYAQLYINEFMAANNQTIMDNANQYEDWIEIYNNYDYAFNVSDLFLTDDFSEPKKWALPYISIPAKGFLLIWADDDTKQGSTHANFKLGADGEQIGLYDGTNFLDSLTFSWQTSDFSYGRYPDGSSEWYSYYEPTPNAPNNIPITEYAAAPAFSLSGGFYNSSVTVELSVLSTDAKIYYTLDCSDPTKQSMLYSEPIVIDSMTVIRARTYEDGYIPSEIISNTYLIDKNHHIATVSIVTDPKNLWDPDIGICQNPFETGDKWERPATVEFFEADNLPGFSLPVGIRINNEISRALEKLSFQIYLRSEYGQSWLSDQLFHYKDIHKFKRLVLNSTFQDSPANTLDNSRALLRDAIGYELGQQIEKTISLANRPVVVYLNNEPWGIYYILEKIDKYFLETNFEIENGDIIENYSEAKEGSMDRWNEMIEFFKTNDLSQSENYEKAKSYIDIKNFTRYNVVEIYTGNLIWPDNNNIAYSSKDGNNNWKWLLMDLDHAFLYSNVNTFERATAEDLQGTIILRKLLENEEYKAYYINSFADYFNTILLPDHVKTTIDSLAAIIRSDIYFEIDRWGGNLNDWEESINFLKQFADHRLNVLYDYLMGEFNVKNKQLVTIEAPQGGQGKIRVNNIYIADFPWSGIYFKEVPIELEAIASPGFKFDKWSDPSLPDTAVVTITLSTDYDVYPVFESDTVNYDIVINEINYNSTLDFDPADWVEIYNFSEDIIDVSGWYFQDSNELHDFVFPSNIAIKANGFLVLCRDTTAFHGSFPSVTDYIGDINFGLSGEGELLKLYDERGNLVDSLTYNNEPPWPTEPNGQGATLELIDPALDNALPESWQASNGHGTPGESNSKPISLIHYKTRTSEIPTQYKLCQNYPNPFNATTTIKYQLPSAGAVTLQIFDVSGRLAQTLIKAEQAAGYYEFPWNGKDDQGQSLPSGLYFYRIQVGDFQGVKKLLLLK